MCSTAERVWIEAFSGDRAELADLFTLADDSPAAIAAYRDLGTLLVARDNMAAIGLALVIANRARGLAELKALAIDPRRQRTGLGRRLVDAAVTTARQQGVAILQVSTASADIGNLRFYQRVGFRMARIVRDAFTPMAGYPEDTTLNGIPLCDQVIFDRAL